MKLIDLLFDLIGSLFKLIIELITMIYNTSRYTPSKTYNAKLISPSNILKKNGAGFSAGGLYSITDPKALYAHSIIFGNTGTGKSTIFSSVSLLNLCGMGNIVALDPSRELEKIVRKKYEENGYEIIRIDFSDRTGAVSDGWSPFPEDPEDLSGCLESMIQIQLGNQSDPYWQISAHSLLLCLGKTLYALEPKYRTFASLYDLLMFVSGANQELADKFISRYSDEANFASYLSFQSNSDNLKASIYSTARSIINVFSMNGIRRITSNPTFDLKKIREGKVIVFLQTNPAEVIQYKILIASFFDQLITNILRKMPSESDASIFAILDEAGVIRVPALPMGITQLRKYRCGLQILAQTEDQLYSLYSKELGNTIISNTFSRIYMTNQSLSTAQRLQEISGKTEYVDSETGVKSMRYLLLADEIRSLPEDKAILLYGSQRISVIPLLPYYKNKRFNKWVNQPFEEKDRTLPIENVPMLPIEELLKQSTEGDNTHA